VDDGIKLHIKIISMRWILFIKLIFLSSVCIAQADTTKWLRAFPITDYLINLNDSTKLVQVEMPDGIVMKEKQVGLLRGVYNSSRADTAEKGYGRCHLIKSNYYYFAIGNNKSGVEIKAGDLIYTFMNKTTIFYGQVPKLASHFIQLQDVYEVPLYDRYLIFNNWTKEKEKTLIDSMVVDIKFTGNYFIQNDPSMDKLATSGQFKGNKTLSVMANCQPAYVKDFLDYMIARPRLYAGKKWKISEIFATWVSEGAPTVVKE
jgi:hypothetical protein